jgi:hypothetical protein
MSNINDLSDLSPSVESMLFVIEVEIEKAEPILRICRILMICLI